MATIRDVARRAGVAPASVTRVLGNYPNVSEDLRERVTAAVEEVGYRPDLVAAGLRRGYTKSIGVMVNDILNPVVAQWIDVIEEELRAAGYGVILANSRGDRENDLANLHLLSQRRVDGLIASLADDSAPEVLAAMSELTIPRVLLDREMDLEGTSSVVSDHGYASRALALHLLDRGHREIGVISGSPTAFPSRERLAALEATLAERGVPLRPELRIAGRGSEEFAARSLSFLLERPDPPTAIVVGNGNTAALAGVLHELRRRSLRVGVDIALAVAENGALATLHTPAITAVERDVIEVGRRAAALVLSRLARPSSQSHTIVLPTRLVVRESTDWRLASR